MMQFGRVLFKECGVELVLCCRHHKGYEEVKVPAAKKSAPEPGEKVVLIEEMEEWAQLAFSGYK